MDPTFLEPAGTLTAHIFPDFKLTQLELMEGDCTPPSLTALCPNYVITEVDVPAPGDITNDASGVGIWSVTYNEGPNGVPCFEEEVQVPWSCGAACPVATIGQGIVNADVCEGEVLTLSVNIAPATAVIDVAYTLQWQKDGVDIPGETGLTYSPSITADDCDILNESYGVVFTCLDPGDIPQTLDFGTITIHPNYDANLVTTNSVECEIPAITVDCPNYVVTADNVPASVNDGETGTAIWTISSAFDCFNEVEITQPWSCSDCAIIDNAIAEVRTICDGDVIDMASIEASLAYTDDFNTSTGTITWFTQLDLSGSPILAIPPVYNGDGCNEETITLYAGLDCNKINGNINAGELTITIYPQPSEPNFDGNCALMLEDITCNNSLTIEYFDVANNSWATSVSQDSKLNGTVDWRAYHPNAPDNDGDGLPDCIINGTAVADAINPPVAVSDQLTVCEGESNTAAFEVSVANGQLFNWYDENGNLLQEGATITYIPATVGTYSIEAYTIAGTDTCKSATINATLTELPLDDANFTYDNSTYCPNDANPLPDMIVTSGGTFSISDGASIDASTGEIDLSTLNATTTYTVTYSTNGACPASTTFDVNMTDSNIGITMGNDLIICPGDAIDLTAVVSGANNIQWTSDELAGSFSDVNGLTTGFTPDTYAAGTYQFVVMATDDCGITQEGFVNVTIEPEYVLNITADETEVLIGTSTQLQASGSGSGNYNWEPNPTLSCDDCPNPIVAPVEQTVYTLMSDDLCVEPVSIIIDIRQPDRLVVPSAFSPNGDYVNDVFTVAVRGNLETYDMIVYNRWGIQVFHTNDPNTGWDGMYNGEKQEIGVYVYVVTYRFENDKDGFIKGNFTLLR